MQQPENGDRRTRVVVVGAGSAGCVLAATLAERFEVVLVEAGRRINTGTDAAHDPDDLIAHPPAWALPAQLTATKRSTATPGRAVGGSSVVNGGYFAAPEVRDLERWHAAGGAAWEPDRVRAHIASIVEKLGVRSSPQTHPVAKAFAEASELAGYGDGLLELATTFADGTPRNVADAFLTDSRVRVRADCRAVRIVVDGGRATGVEIADADGEREVLAADEIVLCAGGFGTARLLLASGIGPAAALREVGIEPVADLPGVGIAFSDHPALWVEWVPTPALAERSLAPEAAYGAFPVALRLGADGAAGDDIELLACTQPPNLDAAHPSETFGVIVGLQRPHSRGTVGAASAHPFAAPRIDYGYLHDPRDRAALRVGVRRAAALVTSSAFSGLALRLVDLDDATLSDEDLLDDWIAQRLTSAAHACGTAAMGADTDALAVTDGEGRVRGVAGLRIADTSLLPVVPSRAPAAAAMAVGAIIAGQMCRAD